MARSTNRGINRGRYRISRFGRDHKDIFIRGKRYRGYGSGSSNDGADYYEKQMDEIQNSALTPVFFSGTLTFYGRDTYVTNHLNAFQTADIPQY